MGIQGCAATSKTRSLTLATVIVFNVIKLMSLEAVFSKTGFSGVLIFHRKSNLKLLHFFPLR